MVTRILVVDDEKTTRLALCEAFTRLGYETNHAATGDEALVAIAADFYDVVILDLEMPGTKGVKVLAEAEELAPDTAFIVLTAYASTDTAIAALRSGAFDYLRKPSSLEVIVTAVKKALAQQQERKRQKEAARLLQQALHTFRTGVESSTSHLQRQTAGITIDERKQTATYKGHPLDLTPIEYKLLHKFVRHPDTVLAYTELARESHNLELDESEARALLRTHIYRLSRKLGQKDESPLQSVRGRGVILYSTLPSADG